MPTALRDMQPWRRAVVEAGLTYAEVSEATGKSVSSIEAYAIGRRKAPADFTAKVLQLASLRIDEPTEATA